MEINPLNSSNLPVESLTTLPTWAAILIFILVFGVLLVGVHFLFLFLKRWAIRKGTDWLQLTLRSIDRSLSLFVVAGAIGLIPVVFPMIGRWGREISLAAAFLTVLALALFVQRLLLALHHRYILSQESLRTYWGLSRVLINGVVYCFFLLIFLDSVGISVTPLIASLGIGSIAVAFALQETLASLFSGFYLITDRPIRVGDYVKIETGEGGHVESIGWRSVRIRAPQNNVIIVPNSKLARSIITNYYLPDKEIVVPIEVSLDYSSGLERVEAIAIEIARGVMKTVAGAVKDFEPTARFQTFTDAKIKMTVILRAQAFEDQPLVTHEFLKRLTGRFQKEGIWKAG